ncbi:unnamed protein product [Lasius platythorax]|uniref:Uncharacterized protein n=1 Tax=Lasius platythorax TaxID=488582 RepID=A0AAV2MZ47_9HYME
MQNSYQELYSSIEEELVKVVLGQSSDVSTIRRTKGKVFKLARYLGRTPPSWLLLPWVTCAYPLYLYYTLIMSSGQTNSASDIYAIV